jgi:hypothetical protein
MEAMVASLARETPEPAPEPPALVAAATEPEIVDGSPTQPPLEPVPTPEAIAVAAAQTDVPAQEASGQTQAPPPPEPVAVALPMEEQPEAASAAAPAEAAPLRVTAVGDSVMLAAASDLSLAIGDIEVDAVVGRPVSVAIDVLRALRDASQLGDVVVIHIGNNSPFSASEFDEMMELTADVNRVVFVNLKVPRGWEGPNNAVLAEGVARYPNAALVDWYAASVDQPQFLLDGVHLAPEGVQAYVKLVTAYALP